jgi:parvulin-like peptidyl-prolyl isomerase
MKKSAVFCALIIAAFGIAACKQKGTTIAKVGGTDITAESFETRVYETPRQYQEYISTDAGKRQFLDLLVREAVILESAKQAGTAKKEEFKNAIAEFKKEQSRQLEEYSNNLLIELYLNGLQENGINVTETEIKQYYDEHPDYYQTPVSIMARHILVPSRQEAEGILEQLKGGAKFETLAKEFSTDKVSAENGGQIGPFKRNDLVPEFENVVFSMKDGEISDIVETPFGYHIIMKVSSSPLPPMTFEAAAQEIKRVIEKNKFDAWFDNAKKTLNVTEDYDKLKDVLAHGNDFTAEEEIYPGEQNAADASQI